jgi:hypothetical protein
MVINSQPAKKSKSDEAVIIFEPQCHSEAPQYLPLPKPSGFALLRLCSFPYRNF